MNDIPIELIRQGKIILCCDPLPTTTSSPPIQRVDRNRAVWDLTGSEIATVAATDPEHFDTLVRQLQDWIES